MSLNVENVEMFMNLSAFAVQERIKVRARLAGNRKERSFFPRSHQWVQGPVTVSEAVHLHPAGPMGDSPELDNIIRPWAGMSFGGGHVGTYWTETERKQYEHLGIAVNRCGMGAPSGIHPSEIWDFHLNEQQLPGRRPEKNHHTDRYKRGKPPQVEPFKRFLKTPFTA